MPAFVPPISPAIKKGIPIINPETGTTLPKDEKPSFFKPPGPGSKRLTIVDPSTKDSEAREKKEREDAELAAAAAAKEKRKQEEEEKERLEKERLEKERLEKERLEKERLEKERLEKERLEQERLEQERLEQERLEQERLEKERLEREEKEKKEKERLEREEKERLAVETQKKKDQEQKELDHNRVIRKAEEDELKRQEAKKKEVEVASQKLGRPPNPIDISPIPAHLTQSPVSSPVSSPVEKPRVVTRVLEDPSTVEYPSHVTAAPTKSKKELGKLVYETEFLMQFQGLCLQTTADLSVMKELMESVNNKSNSNMQRRQTSERNRSGRNHGGDAMFKMGSRDGNRMEMGKFNMGRPLTSRTASGYNEQLASGGSGRGGSSRGRGGMKVTRNPPQIQGAPTIPIDQVTPLEKSENRWVPISDSGTPAVPGEGELVPKEVIIRKVNALLNKLTLEKFDSISQQIFDYANQSIQEEDGKSLRTVIRLMFEKACDEPAFAAMWARLARFIHDKISDQVIDINITGKDGKPVKGKALYRKYLLNRCQIEFEKGWKVNMPEVKDGEMLTDEYYAAAKAKRQGLGLIAYIGEAYKMDMLSHKIMLGCFARLCVDPGNISDEEAESLCKLIRTAGQKFDRETTSQRWMEALINRIKEEMMFSPNISSRIKFMLQVRKEREY
jgi:translation initiation factor 4G